MKRIIPAIPILLASCMTPNSPDTLACGGPVKIPDAMTAIRFARAEIAKTDPTTPSEAYWQKTMIATLQLPDPQSVEGHTFRNLEAGGYGKVALGAWEVKAPRVPGRIDVPVGAPFPGGLIITKCDGRIIGVATYD